LPSGPLEDLGLIPQPPNSYDDGRFAYRKMIQGESRDEIYVYDLATKKSTLITANGDYPSLRGSFLAYTSHVEGGGGYALFLRNLDSGQTTKVSSGTEWVTGVDAGVPTSHPSPEDPSGTLQGLDSRRSSASVATAAPQRSTRVEV
jgi:hypothetical protein